MAWVIGNPALNMTESWRLKTARVLSETPLFLPIKGMLSLSFLRSTLSTWICSFSRAATISSELRALRSPSMMLPTLFFPRYLNIGMFFPLG